MKGLKNRVRWALVVAKTWRSTASDSGRNTALRRPSVARTVLSAVWWVVGALLPVVVILLVMVASPATNWTLGLPFLRTSVDHGTAFGIAGKNLADAEPLRQVVQTTLRILRGELPRRRNATP